MSAPTPAEIRSLVRLLDDDHPVVRAAVKRRVAELGDDLERGLAELEPEASGGWIPQLRRLRTEFQDERFREAWTSVLTQSKPDPERLEDALILLALRDAPSGMDEETLRGQLDSLARGFRLLVPRADFRHLALHLFGTGRFTGNEDDYYGPKNSNLAWVLQERRGNPILLACVMILVGRRIGLEIGGCNFPAHFLARYLCPESGRLYFIDCFNEGRVFPAELLLRHRPPGFEDAEEVIQVAAPVEVILGRVLRNLERALDQSGRPEEQRFARELWHRLAEGRR